MAVIALGGEARAVPEPARTDGLFLELTPTRAGLPDRHPRAASGPHPIVAKRPESALLSDGALRSRPVAVDVRGLDGARKAVAQRRPAQLRLNLFPDVNLSTVIERTSDTRFGSSLSGRIDGQQHSGVTLVVNGKTLAGAVHSQQGTCLIAFRNGAMHTIREIIGELNCGFDGPCPVRSFVGTQVRRP